MVRIGLGGDPLQLEVDWRSTPNPLDVCLLLLTKLSLSQLNSLHTHMSGVASSGTKAMSPLSAAKRSHACTLTQFQEAYHRTLDMVALDCHKATINERLECIFRHYDANGDETLTFEELTILKEMLHTGTFEDDDEETQHAAKKADVTIYNELSVSIEWECTADRLLGERPEWTDCSRVKYHPGIRRYSVSWKNDLILFEIVGEDENNARPTGVIRGHVSPIITCLHVPHVKRLFTCGTDRLVLSWHETDGWSRGERATVSSAQVSIVYDPTTQFLFTGGTDGGIYLYPTVPKFGQPVQRIDAHSGWVNDLIIISDLECVVSCSADATIKFFSTSSLELRTTKSIPQSEVGVNFIMYAKKDRTIYSAISGREVQLWSPFLSKPTEILKGHDKPIVGLQCFDNRPEVVTVDLCGKICIWDMRTTTIKQVLGSPDSLSPIGTTHSVAYNVHQQAIMCLGDRSMSLFVPQKGSCSALLDSCVTHVIFDSVHKALICASGSRIVYFELTTGEVRHSHNFGGVEISAIACAVQQQLIVGTEEGRVMAVMVGSWKHTMQVHLRDSVRLVVDLGKKSRLSAIGECPKLLALNAKGTISVLAYGALSEALGGPPMHTHTEFVGVEVATYSSKHGYLFMGRKQMFEVWDVIYQTRKTTQILPHWITCMKAVDDIDCAVFGTSDGSLHCYHSITCVPSFVVKLSAMPLKRSMSSARGGSFWWSTKASRSFVPLRIAFDRMTWELYLMSEHEVKVFALDRLVRRMLQYQLHASVVFSHAKVIHKRYTVDINAVDVVPYPVYSCRSKFHPQLLLALVTTRGTGKDTERSHMERIQRLVDLKAACRPPNDDGGFTNDMHQGDDEGHDLLRLTMLPIDYFIPAATDRLEVDGNRHIVFVVMPHLPAARVLCPTKHYPHIALQQQAAPGSPSTAAKDGAALRAAGAGTSAAFRKLQQKRRSTVAAMSLQKSVGNLSSEISEAPGEAKKGPITTTTSTSINAPLSSSLAQHPQPQPSPSSPLRSASPKQASNPAAEVSSTPAVLELRWMIFCVVRALQELHTHGFVALFQPSLVRYVAPYFKVCLPDGVWAVGEDATGALEAHLCPPEGLSQVSPAADMWLLGLLLFKCVTGKDIIDVSQSTTGVSAFDLIARIVGNMEQQVFDAYRDPTIIHVLRRVTTPHPLRRALPGEVVSLLGMTLHHPPKHLLRVPLQASETRHEIFVVEEKDASYKRSIHPALRESEFNCMTVCEVPCISVVVEFNGSSAHLIMWSDNSEVVGVTPPNSSITSIYSVGREEINNVRLGGGTAVDLTLLDDPTVARKGKYRPEAFCPFYTETKILDKSLGVVAEALPPPYYLEGWHKLKRLDLNKRHNSQKQRDALRQERWRVASANAKTTNFEKTLLTVDVPLERSRSPGGGHSEDDLDVGMAGPTAPNVCLDIEIPVEDDRFLLGRMLHPHWGKPLLWKAKRTAETAHSGTTVSTAPAAIQARTHSRAESATPARRQK